MNGARRSIYRFAPLRARNDKSEARYMQQERKPSAIALSISYYVGNIASFSFPILLQRTIAV